MTDPKSMTPSGPWLSCPGEARPVLPRPLTRAHAAVEALEAQRLEFVRSEVGLACPRPADALYRRVIRREDWVGP